jgi:hypothetical protein
MNCRINPSSAKRLFYLISIVCFTMVFLSCKQEIEEDNLPDIFPPFIASVFPKNGSIDATVDCTIIATFVEPVALSSLTGSTFSVVQDGNLVSGVYSVDGNSAVYSHLSIFQKEKTIAITLSGEITDTAGNLLFQDYSWNFETTRHPTVISTSPSDGAANVAYNSSMSVTFSEAMTSSTLSSDIADTSCSGSFQVSMDDFSTCVKMSDDPSSDSGKQQFTVTPVNLKYGVTYKIRITTVAKDANYNPLTSDYTQTNGFTTIDFGNCNNFTDNSTSGSGIDITPPALSCVDFSPSSLSGSGTVTIAVGLTDSGSGVSMTNAYLYSPTKLQNNSTGGQIYIPLSYNSTTQLWEGNANLENYHESGTWKVGHIYTYDNAGNYEYYQIDSSTSTINYSYHDGVNFIDSGVSIAGMELSGTSGDIQPPILTSVAVSPSSLSGSGTVTIAVGLTDSGSGVSTTYAYLYSPTKLQNNSSGVQIYVSLSYNSTTQLWEGTATLENHHESGTWKVGHIYTYDNAGNNEYYQIDSSTSTINYSYHDGVNNIDSGVPIAGFTK